MSDHKDPHTEPHKDEHAPKGQDVHAPAKPAHPKPSTPSFISKYGKGIGAGLVVLLVLVGLVYWATTRENNGEDDQASIDEIRDAFPPVTDNGQNSDNGFFGDGSTPPTGGPATTTPPTTTPPVTESTPTPTPTPAPVTPAPAPLVFRSTAQGYEILLPAGWVTDPNQNTSSKSLFFNYNTGALVGYISVYPNTSNDTLETLERIYQGSPEVATVGRITAAGLPALGYSTTDGKNVIAIIHGSNVYYFHGQLASTNILKELKFL